MCGCVFEELGDIANTKGQEVRPNFDGLVVPVRKVNVQKLVNHVCFTQRSRVDDRESELFDHDADEFGAGQTVFPGDLQRQHDLDTTIES
jgi:hypothetical protein